MTFTDRVAFITGAARGIGKAMAACIVNEGGRVVIADIDHAAAEGTARELDADHTLALACDVSSVASVEAAVEAAVDAFGALDILVNNAGLHLLSWNRPVTTLTAAEWRQLLDVNVVGIVNCARACRPHLTQRDGAAILNMSSIAGFASDNAYGVSKLAVRGLTTALAREFADDGIRVNALAPGAIDSENAMHELPSDLLTDLIQVKQLVKRQGTRSDLVEAMRFLCSDSASFITGETLIVGGGFPLRV